MAGKQQKRSRTMKAKTTKYTVQKLANSIAREHGHGTATTIIICEIGKPRIGQTTRYGWRKNTTGEYVPQSYRSNFGWKNTFYQSAAAEVIIPRRLARKCIDYRDFLIARKTVKRA
jgi:hypothetical protein